MDIRPFRSLLHLPRPGPFGTPEPTSHRLEHTCPHLLCHPACLPGAEERQGNTVVKSLGSEGQVPEVTSQTASLTSCVVSCQHTPSLPFCVGEILPRGNFHQASMHVRSSNRHPGKCCL